MITLPLNVINCLSSAALIVSPVSAMILHPFSATIENLVAHVIAFLFVNMSMVWMVVTVWS